MSSTDITRFEIVDYSPVKIHHKILWVFPIDNLTVRYACSCGKSSEALFGSGILLWSNDCLFSIIKER